MFENKGDGGVNGGEEYSRWRRRGKNKRFRKMRRREGGVESVQ